MGRKLTKQENPMEIFLNYSFIFFYLVGGRERGWKENGERKEKWDGKYFFDLSRKVYLNVKKKKKKRNLDQSINMFRSIKIGVLSLPPNLEREKNKGPRWKIPSPTNHPPPSLPSPPLLLHPY
jgi:hypothetical protein